MRLTELFINCFDGFRMIGYGLITMVELMGGMITQAFCGLNIVENIDSYFMYGCDSFFIIYIVNILKIICRVCMIDYSKLSL